MYEDFFGLQCKPFQITPDPAFLYLSGAHRKALNYLEYGIQENTGFILLTGEIGAGKTTILRKVMKLLPADVEVARIFNTRVDDRTLMAMINEEFGLDTKDKNKAELQRQLNDFLIERFSVGHQCVLMIDEAQNLSRDLIEEVRLLSNLETDKRKLLQIVLIGQPELRAMLLRADLEQLAQRITVGCHLRPLRPEEVEEYVRHRLAVAGNANAVSFDPGVVGMVFQFSGGIPRLINVVCEWALLSAFSEQTRTISIDLVREITAEMDADRWPVENGAALKSVTKEQAVMENATVNMEKRLEPVYKRLDEMAERVAHLERLVTSLGISVLEKVVRGRKDETIRESLALLEKAFGGLTDKETNGSEAGKKDRDETNLRLLKKDDVA